MARSKKVIRTKRIYRGHARRPRQILRGILFAFLLLLLIAVGYIVCREWTRFFGPNAKKPESSALTESSQESDASQEEEESSEPLPTVSEVKGVVVPYESARLTGDALDGYLAGVKSQGYTHVLVELKNEDGVVLFQTDAPQAVSFGVTDASAFDASVFTAAAKRAGLTPAAVITALRDPLVSHVSNNNSFAYADQLTTNWMDTTPELGGRSWLNPYMEKARSYITELTSDAAKKGFELIVLTDVNFPTRNTLHMNTILTEPSRNEILGQLLDEVQTAAGTVPVLNSVDFAEQLVLTENAPYMDWREIGYGKNAPYISLAEIQVNCATLAQRFSVEADSVQVARAMLQKLAGDSELSGALVPIIPAADEAALRPILQELSIDSYIIS